MKKFVSVVLSFVMVVSMLSVLPVTAFALDDSGSCGDDVTWSFDGSTGTLTLSGSGETKDYEETSKPSPFQTNADIKTVIVEDGITRIGKFLFFSCPNLESVTIGDTVVAIGEYAFCGCTKLSALSFGNGVKTLAFAAFGNCTGLVNLNLPDSLETIGNSAFDSCAGLVNVVLPDGVKRINGQAFYECTSLKTVSLGQVETIGSSAFSGCTALTELVIPKTVTSIANGAFSRTNALASISVDSENPVYDSRNNCNGVIETATNKLVVVCKKTVIPASVTAIGNAVFSGRDIESFTVPEGITQIETNAFSSCTSLKTIFLPKTLKTIENAAFFNCKILAEVYYAGSETDKTGMSISDQYGHNDYFINAKWYYDCIPEHQIGDSVFYRLDGDTVEIYGTGAMYDYSATNLSPLSDNTAIKTVNVGSGVTGVGDFLFCSCQNLTTVSLPDSIKTIGRSAFLNCFNLTTVNLPEGLTTIGTGAFQSCYNNLSEIAIPSTVTTIGNGVFIGCSRLTSITIPSGVTIIMDSTFSDCTGLKTVTLDKNTTTVERRAFENCNALTDVYYTGSRNDKLNITFRDGNDALKNADWHYISKIGDDVYYYIDGDTVEIFGTGAMYDYSLTNPSPLRANTAIKTVNVGSGVTGVGNNLFFDCQNLTTVSLPDSIKTIGYCAFTNCFNLTTVNLPEGLTTIGTSAFQSCEKLSEIAIPSTVTTIGDGVFIGCSRLTSITIPSGVTIIMDSTFCGCTGLKTVTLDKNTTTVEDWAFDHCSALTDVYYTGSATDKDNMSIGTDGNDTFINADWHLNYNPMKGTGTSADPYQITDYAQLMTFAAIVNGGQTTACGKLMNDIVCKYNETDTAYAANWTPIGIGTATAYTGTFDGQNKVIRGLTTAAGREYYCGLFGYVDETGTVQNVGLEDSVLTCEYKAGAIAGLNVGTIRNCYNTGTIIAEANVGGIAGQNGGTIINCYNTANITGLGFVATYLGGIVGDNENGTVVHCYNTGDIEGSANIGGIAGINQSGGSNACMIQNCYNTGAVTGEMCVGGIAAENHADDSTATAIVQNCYNTGNVTATGANSEVGGMVARNYAKGRATVENCYNTGAVTGGPVAGGIAGINVRIAGTGSAEMLNCFYNSALCGCDKAVFSSSGTVNNVKALTTAEMTGEAANDTATMKALFDAVDDNGKKVWLDPKANGEDNGTTYLYYPHLMGFNCKADGTPETDSAQISAADWPAKIQVGVVWDEAASYTYNGSAQGPTVTSVSFGGKQLGATEYTVRYLKRAADMSWRDAEPVDAAHYKAIVTVTANSLTFEKAFTINQAELTITAKDQTYTYNGSEQGVKYATYTSDLDSKVTLLGLQGSDELLSITLEGYATDAGDYPDRIVPSNPDLGDVETNYIIACEPGTLSIRPRAITITAASDSWTYDGDSHESTAVTVTSGSLCAGDELIATATGSVKDIADTASGNNPVAAGYKIMHGNTDMTGNYAITAVAGKLTIKPRAVSITAASDSWTYDGNSHESTAVTVTSGALVAGHELVAAATGSVQDVTDTATGNNPVAAGYKIMHGNTDVTDNYDVTAVAGTLTVTPKDVTVKADDINIKYGDAEPTLTATVTGLVTGDTVDYDLTREAGDDVGEYTITASGDEDQGNYKVAYQNGIFNISEADAPTPAADEKPTANTLVEDGTAQELVAAPTSLPNGYTGVEYKLGDGDWSADIPTASDPGDYNVHVRYIGDGNHTDFVGDSVSVHVKALYTVTWLNDDGSEFAQKTFAEDEEEPTVTDEPEKAADAQYTYTFQAWFKDDSSTVSNVIYNAIYTNTLNKYTVEFVDEDGTVLQSEEVEYGTVPTFNGSTPAKEATAEFTYTFGGWDSDVEAVTGTATYTATYTATKNKYTVAFVDEDGTVLQSEELEYGTMPEYNGETPAKASTVTFTFMFNGWDSPVKAVTGDATYTATYTKTRIEKKPAGDDVPPTPERQAKDLDDTTDKPREPDIIPVPEPAPRVDNVLATLPGNGSGAAAEYTVNGGSKLVWEQNSDQDLVIPVNSSVANESALTHFKQVLIDGKPFACKVDFDNSTVTIPAVQLSTLLPGTHKLTLVFDDGNTKQEQEIELEVEPAVKAPSVGAAAPAEAPTATPAESKGFDKKHLLWIVPVGIAGILAGAIFGTKKRRGKKK